MLLSLHKQTKNFVENIHPKFRQRNGLSQLVYYNFVYIGQKGLPSIKWINGHFTNKLDTQNCMKCIDKQ